MNKQRPIGQHTAIDNLILALLDELFASDIRLHSIVVRDAGDYERLESLYKSDLFGQLKPRFHKQHMTIFHDNITLTHSQSLQPAAVCKKGKN